MARCSLLTMVVRLTLTSETMNASMTSRSAGTTTSRQARFINNASNASAEVTTSARLCRWYHMSRTLSWTGSSALRTSRLTASLDHLISASSSLAGRSAILSRCRMWRRCASSSFESAEIISPFSTCPLYRCSVQLARKRRSQHSIRCNSYAPSVCHPISLSVARRSHFHLRPRRSSRTLRTSLQRIVWASMTCPTFTGCLSCCNTKAPLRICSPGLPSWPGPITSSCRTGLRWLSWLTHSRLK
mmetsp:Transcript_5463/g.13361  ORF Transcript_5463/g.13361 Transcript_5463/m.13361 type:complete len:244 (-) Transcript_5463:1022-1753(-)